MEESTQIYFLQEWESESLLFSGIIATLQVVSEFLSHSIQSIHPFQRDLKNQIQEASDEPREGKPKKKKQPKSVLDRLK